MAAARENSSSIEQKKYTRDTELRHLRPNDLYGLAVMLENDEGWKKLMKIIPNDPQKKLIGGPIKYNKDHINLIENAIMRPGETRLFAQILFDEWATSGKKHERPTLDILMHLLLHIGLMRPADFVAEKFLGEEPPMRPSSGPAARINISITDELFDDMAEIYNDSSYFPGTATLNDNAFQSTAHVGNNNIDYYAKFHVAKYLTPLTNSKEPPQKPPRRRALSKRVLVSPLLATTPGEDQTEEQQPNNSVPNIPKFSMLICSDTSKNNSTIVSTGTNYSQSSVVESESERLETIGPSQAPIPIISILERSNRSTSTDEQNSNHTHSMTTSNDPVLPLISALHLNETTQDQLTSRDISTDYSSSGTSITRSEVSVNSSEACTDYTNHNTHNTNPSTSNEDSRSVSATVSLVNSDSREAENNIIPNLSILQQPINHRNEENNTEPSDENYLEINSKSIGNIPFLSALNNK